MMLTILFYAAAQVAATGDGADARAADARQVADLNTAIQRHNDAIADRAAKADAAYQRERQKYEAALAENDRARKEAQAQADAYKVEQARYQAMLARIDTAKPLTNAIKTAAKPRKPDCYEETITGTHRTRTVCQ